MITERAGNALSAQSPQFDMRKDFRDTPGVESDIRTRKFIVSNDSIKPDHTLHEHPRLPLKELLSKPKQEDLEDKLVENAIISASTKAVHLVLTKVNEWPRLWPNVLEVRLNYDDGKYQEFMMSLVMDTSRTYSIRSVRRSDPDRVIFFNPEPASFLKHHYGEWLIRSLGQNVTQLTATQHWTRSANSETQMPAHNGLTSEQRISDVLRQHARMELTLVKESLECAEIVISPYSRHALSPRIGMVGE